MLGEKCLRDYLIDIYNPDTSVQSTQDTRYPKKSFQQPYDRPTETPTANNFFSSRVVHNWKMLFLFKNKPACLQGSESALKKLTNKLVTVQLFSFIYIYIIYFELSANRTH